MRTVWSYTRGKTRPSLVLSPVHEEKQRLEDGHAQHSTARDGSIRDNIRCLDGLRGIACLLVFNYHFLWPWTPAIMLGYGALPPQAPEPWRAWSSLPIICLWQRGRPAVAIFFAISGFVISRHALRLIQQRRIETAYQRLASAVFRRAFRLYIPPTISMFLVAVLAQMGAFKSNDAIYKGPDSIYINGTVANVTKIGRVDHCVNKTIHVVGAAGMIKYMGWQDPVYMGNATNDLCINITSTLAGPTSVYDQAHLFEKRYARVLNDTTRLHRFENHDYIPPYVGPAPLDITNGTNGTYGVPKRWVKLGGMWEEHPLIHDNATYALQNFTRVYAEWANPFTFNPYHTRYDPHTFTIPMEFRGSMIVYVFLLGTAALKARWRMALAGFLSVYSLILGRWDISTFMGGTLLSEADIRLSFASNMSLQPPVTGAARRYRSTSNCQTITAAIAWWLAFILGLYLLSYPDAAAEYTPGYITLAYMLPRYYGPIAGWAFYNAIGALMLLPCILRSPSLMTALESRIPRYLGQISFSFYLVHGPVLHSLGFWIMPRLFDRLERPAAYLAGYVILLTVSLNLANWWCRRIDSWSTTVGKRVEQRLLES